jgi:hypothetical protein
MAVTPLAQLLPPARTHGARPHAPAARRTLFTDQLILVARSLRGGPIFPALYTTPSVP